VLRRYELPSPGQVHFHVLSRLFLPPLSPFPALRFRSQKILTSAVFSYLLEVLKWWGPYRARVPCPPPFLPSRSGPKNDFFFYGHGPRAPAVLALDKIWCPRGSNSVIFPCSRGPLRGPPGPRARGDRHVASLARPTLTVGQTGKKTTSCQKTHFVDFFHKDLKAGSGLTRSKTNLISIFMRTRKLNTWRWLYFDQFDQILIIFRSVLHAHLC